MELNKFKILTLVSWLPFLLFLSLFVFQLYALDVILQRTEVIPGEKTTEIEFSEWNIIHVKKSFYVSGKIIQSVDMDNSYMRGMDLEYKPRGSENFVKAPFRIPKTKVCDFYNTVFKKYMMSSIEGHSNLPAIPPEGLCPIPKGTYFVNNASIDASVIPSSVPSGLWKAEETFYKNDEVVGGLRAFLKILK